MTFKIENGKTYLRRDRKKVKIIFKTAGDYPYVGQLLDRPYHISGYSESGGKQGWSNTSPTALVEEYKEPTYEYQPIFKNYTALARSKNYEERWKTGGTLEHPFLGVIRIDQETNEVVFIKAE